MEWRRVACVPGKHTSWVSWINDDRTIWMTADGMGRRWRWMYIDGRSIDWDRSEVHSSCWYSDSAAARRGAERWLKRNKGMILDAV